MHFYSCISCRVIYVQIGVKLPLRHPAYVNIYVHIYFCVSILFYAIINHSDIYNWYVNNITVKCIINMSRYTLSYPCEQVLAANYRTAMRERTSGSLSLVSCIRLARLQVFNKATRTWVV